MSIAFVLHGRLQKARARPDLRKVITGVSKTMRKRRRRADDHRISWRVDFQARQLFKHHNVSPHALARLRQLAKRGLFVQATGVWEHCIPHPALPRKSR